jgi:uroporphyrin-III C-methyltransferase
MIRYADEGKSEAQGVVFLIGAGPGDPGLITVKGLSCLREAEVVVYDRLVAPLLLGEACADAELINVGKASGHHSIPQEDINALLIRKARAGKWVARLKGGDPVVFGRGGEEAEALAEAGIPFEIIPGVTSAIAVPAYAGIPVTQRGVASSFTVMTGHRDSKSQNSSSKCQMPSQGLPRGINSNRGTLVVLMCVENLPVIVADLMDAGWNDATPAALIIEGTTPRQRTIVGTLGDIAAKAKEAEPPALLVVGEVVRLRERLEWFEKREMAA